MQSRFYFWSCSVDEQLVIHSYLAAIRPSSIRHRHTSRGCLWRTSGSTCVTYRQRGCRGTNRKKVTYLKGKIFPEISFCFCQKKKKKSGACSLNIEDMFQEVFCLYCASLSLNQEFLRALDVLLRA